MLWACLFAVDVLAQNGLITLLYQAAIVGGGPAGLQAALTLGRMHVETLVFDDVRYRNAASPMMGNVLGWDGAEPAALRTSAHSELVAYPWVRIVPHRADSVRDMGQGMVLVTSGAEWGVERLLIASGVEDALLPIPGVHELWGDVVLPCPYCHGHEFASGRIAVISDGSHAEVVLDRAQRLRYQNRHMLRLGSSPAKRACNAPLISAPSSSTTIGNQN